MGLLTCFSSRMLGMGKTQVSIRGSLRAVGARLKNQKSKHLHATHNLLYHPGSRSNEVLLCPAVVTGWLQVRRCASAERQCYTERCRFLLAFGCGLRPASRTVTASAGLRRHLRAFEFKGCWTFSRSAVRWLYGFMAIPIVVLLVMCLHQFSGSSSEIMSILAVEEFWGRLVIRQP